MKKLFSLLLLCIFLLFSNLLLCQDFWEETNGPEGGWTNCIALDKNENIYAGFNGEWFGPIHEGNCLYRSTDGSMTWESLILASIKDVESIIADTAGVIYIWEGGVGVMKSTNGGETWLGIPYSFDASYSAILDVCRNNYLILGHHDGIYISSNNGNMWSLTSLTGQVYSVFTDSSDNIYAGMADNLYRSSDYGSTWYPAGNGLNGELVHSLMQMNDSTFYAGTEIGIYKSQDNCTTWDFQNGSPISITSLSPGKNNEVFAGSRTEGFIVSTDGGKSWLNRSAGLPNISITSMVVLSQNYVVVGTVGDGIFISLTQGRCWQSRNSGIRSNHIAAMINYDGYLFGGSELGILFRSSDRGDLWMRIDSIHTAAGITAFLKSKKNSLFCAGGDIYKSEDGGSTWKVISQLYVKSFSSYFDSTTGREYLLAAADDQGIWISTDDGDIWSPANNGILGYIEGVETNLRGYFYAASTNKIFRSTDFGTSWQIIYANDSLFINHVDVTVSSNDYIYAGFDPGKIFLSTDYGDTWIDRGEHLPVDRINSIETDSLGRVYAGNWWGQIYQSLNYGEDWIDISSGMIGGAVLNLLCDNSGNIYTGPYSGSVYRGINSTFIPPQVKLASPGPGAQNVSLTPELKWHPSLSALYYRAQVSLNNTFDSAGVVFDYYTDDTTCTVDSLQTNTRYYWRVCSFNEYGGGLWSQIRWFKTMNPTSSEQDAKKEYTFNLLQNYPNPFNPSTIIRFSIKNDSRVMLTIFNVLGEKVASLLNEVMRAGEHQVEFDASGGSGGNRQLTSGIYFYVLNAAGIDGTNYTETKKMILLK